MPKITFIGHDDQHYTLNANNGDNLMQLAMDNGVPGIDADCGGSCACGTCHVFIEHKQAVLPASTDLEQSMLSMRPDMRDNSRLSCQIFATENMEGLVLQVPEFQM